MHLNALCTIYISGVSDEVTIEGYTVFCGERRDELVLEETHIVLIEIDFRKEVIEHLGDDFTRIDEFVDAFFALSDDDVLLRIVRLTVNFAGNCLFHRQRKDKLATLGGEFHMVLQERHTLELAFLEDFRCDIGKGKVQLVVLLYLIVVVLLEVLIFLGGNHLLHQLDGRIVLPAIFGLFPHHLCLSETEVKGLEPDVEFFPCRRLYGIGFVSHTRNGEFSARAVGDAEVSVDIGLHTFTRSLIEDVDKRCRLAGLCIADMAGDALCDHHHDGHQREYDKGE